MKPCNFHERANQRRKDALVRLATRERVTPAQMEQVALERAILESRIVVSARDVRTKKKLTLGSDARKLRHGGRLSR